MRCAWHGTGAVALGVLSAVGLLSSAAVRAEAPRSGAGRDLFVTYCASCHGIDGRGGGEVARVLRTPPPDLTRLTDKYGFPLPRKRLAEFIDGRRQVGAHGTREMPVWGRRLYEGEPIATPGVEASKRRTIELMVEYLMSIQELDEA